MLKHHATAYYIGKIQFIQMLINCQSVKHQSENMKYTRTLKIYNTQIFQWLRLKIFAEIIKFTQIILVPIRYSLHNTHLFFFCRLLLCALHYANLAKST